MIFLTLNKKAERKGSKLQFQSDDDPVKRSSTERYSSQFFDNMVLLAALYSVTVATAMFIMPVIHHFMRYHHFDIERFLLTTK